MGLRAGEMVKIQAALLPESGELRPPYSPDANVFDVPGSPKLGDLVWDLTAVLSTPTNLRTVNWGLVPAGPWRQTATEMAFARVREPASGRHARLWKPESIPSFCQAATLLAKACLKLGVRSPTDLHASNGARLIDAVLATGDTGMYETPFGVAIRMFRMSRFLTFAPPEHPFGGLSARIVLNIPAKGENRTPRVPEAIWSPMLVWAERFVTEFAEEILAERRWREALANRPREPRQRNSLVPRMQAVVAELKRNGRGLPYLDHRTSARLREPCDDRLSRLNLGYLSLQCGSGILTRAHLNRSRSLTAFLIAAVESIGFQDDVAKRCAPRSFEALNPNGYAEGRLSQAERSLLVACAILVGAYSGVRPTELWGLERGCCEARQVPGRELPRYYLKGHVYKGREGPAAAEWVTIEVGATAIAVAEALQNGIGRLFTRRRQAGADRDGMFTEAELNRWREHVNCIAAAETEYEIRHGMAAGLSYEEAAQAASDNRIPTEHNGRPFRLTWPQLRRTVAYFIGMQPLGWAAGTRQYKHLSVELFSAGYHGGSASDFGLEVLAWDAVRRAVNYAELHERIASGNEVLAGPAAERLQLDFQTRKRRFRGDIVAHPTRYLNVVRQQDVPLYPGMLCDCRFDPSKALCLMRKSQATDAPQRPSWKSCDPSRCGNAVFHSIHRGPWEAHLQRTRQQLADPDLTAVQRAQYEAQLREDTKVFKEIVRHERRIAPA